MGTYDFDGWRWRVLHRALVGGGIAGFLLALSSLVVGLTGGILTGVLLLGALRLVGYHGWILLPYLLAVPALLLAGVWFKATARPFYRLHRVLSRS